MNIDGDDEMALGAEAMVALPGVPMPEERRAGRSEASAQALRRRPHDYVDDAETLGDDLDERDRDLREMIRQIFALRSD